MQNDNYIALAVGFLVALLISFLFLRTLLKRFFSGLRLNLISFLIALGLAPVVMLLLVWFLLWIG